MDITQAVANMYEMYPYPYYPLLAKPIWQTGYLTSSLFSGRLLFESTGIEPTIWHKKQLRQNSRVLVAGSGEILPFVMRKWEPGNHLMHCIDLSKTSITRAKFRTVFLKSIRFTKSDIHIFLANRPKTAEKFDHVDAYGVIHHLRSPSQTLKLINSTLDNAGTARFMIYNKEARNWIHHLQLAFKTLKLDFKSSKDLATAGKIINMMQRASVPFAAKTAAMKSTFTNKSRFVDTFFHQREVRHTTQQWLDLIHTSNFRILGLFDRYAEFDDLPNPLWQPPSAEELSRRASEKTFENNLELYLTTKFARIQTNRCQHPKYTIPLAASLYKAPPSWFEYEETYKIPLKKRNLIWKKSLHCIFNSGDSQINDSFLDLKALQRLARLGAIFPSQVSEDLKPMLMAPMLEPTIPGQRVGIDLSHINLDEIERFISHYLEVKKGVNKRVFDTSIKRIMKALT